MFATILSMNFNSSESSATPSLIFDNADNSEILLSVISPLTVDLT